MKRAHLAVIAAAALVPALLAGCGSGSSSSSSSAAQAPASSASPAESSSSPAAPSSSTPETASSEPGGALDRDAALAEVDRQISEGGFSEEATSCIVDWASTLNDADLAAAAAPPGGTPPTAEQQAAQAAILVSCARQETIDQFVAGFADTEASEAAQACLANYLDVLTDEELTSLLRGDETAQQSLGAAAESCASAG